MDRQCGPDGENFMGSAEGQLSSLDPPAAFALAIAMEGSETVVRVVGEVDLATAPLLQESLGGLLDDGITEIVVDLAGVSFMDSTGLGTLARSHIRAAESGRRMVLQSTPPAVLKVLGFSGLDQVLNLR